jgi:hypothetical protein
VGPGLVVGVLMVLIGAQVVRLASPRRLPFVWVLLLAAAGFVAGELFAIAVHIGGPLLAGLHPVADCAAIALTEAGGALLSPGRRAP